MRPKQASGRALGRPDFTCRVLLVHLPTNQPPLGNEKKKKERNEIKLAVGPEATVTSFCEEPLRKEEEREEEE